MYSRLRITMKDKVPDPAVIPHKQVRGTVLQLASIIDSAIMAVLTLAALLPRVLLAARLDMVTDEVVYIRGGKLYLPLLLHWQIGARGWLYNYEHPPLLKLLIGLAITLNTAWGNFLGELQAARLPSIIFGTLLVLALYQLGRAPFGRVVALLAALCLAFSPWLVYFSALAYLDMAMTTLVTIAFLLLWHATRRPWCYPLATLLISLGAACKYTAVLAIPGMALFTAYYFLALRPHLPVEQRSPLPWLWWLAAIVLAPLAFLLADPAIWPDPYNLLLNSFRFEWLHSQSGHSNLTFLAGQYSAHVPHWAILYIALAKISVFVTLPALLFVVIALVLLVRFHLRSPGVASAEASSLAFLLSWLLTVIGMFSLLNIVVGTHYDLPVAPPIVLAGAYGLALLLRYRRGMLSLASVSPSVIDTSWRSTPGSGNSRSNVRALCSVVLLCVILAGPHLFGLTTVYAAEGYASELFYGENTALQVAYPAYREALQWLAANTHESGRLSVGLGAMPGTLSPIPSQSIVTKTGIATVPLPIVPVSGINAASWYTYNQDLTARFTLTEAHSKDQTFEYDYLVWPMHLVQRGNAIPEPYQIVHTIYGGNTIYCFITARSAISMQRIVT